MEQHSKLRPAIEDHKYNKVVSLIESGVDVNKKYNNDGETPLSIAIYYGHISIVEFLLKNGADIELTSTCIFLYPIQIAAKHGHLEIVKLLVDHGARIDCRSTWNAVCAIHLAASRGHLEIIDYFLGNGIDIDVASSRGTPIHWAAESHECNVRHLLEKGANVNEKNHEGRTPLHICARSGFTDCIKLLVEQGACVNVKDNFDLTPLHVLLNRNNRFSRNYVVFIPSALNIIKYMLLRNKGQELNFTDYWFPDRDTLQRFCAFSSECKTEIEDMKAVTFGNISLYNFLQDIFDDNRLINHLNNEHMNRLQNIDYLKNDFPIYSSVIILVKDKIKNVKKRLDLLKIAEEEMDAKITPVLPSEMKQKIFSYLTIFNLNRFVNVLNINSPDSKKTHLQFTSTKAIKRIHREVNCRYF